MNHSIIIPYVYSVSGTLELRYCLQSIKKHLRNYGDIFIIGDDPKIDGLIHIPAPNEPAYSQKERNCFNKLLMACEDKRVSEQFLYMNDDHFFLSLYDVQTFPSYYSMTWESGQGLYMNTVENTKANYSMERNYDLHCPLLMTKEGLRKLKKLNWNIKFGYCIKTAYCVENNVEGEYTRDMKISEPTLSAEQIRVQLKERKWFSTGEYVFREEGMRQVLEELYGQKELVK